MASGDHPMRVPFYGALLSVAAFVLCWAAAVITITWVAAAIYVGAAIAAGVGLVMTLRDGLDSPLRDSG